MSEEGTSKEGTSKKASRSQAVIGWVCPYEGERLIPVADTPHWFRCSAKGWKHYFYQKPEALGGGWIDVDTNRPARVRVPRARTNASPPKVRGAGASGSAEG